MADFLVTFPLWMLLHPEAKAKGLIVVTGADGEKATPAFTDEDLAERFQRAMPQLRHYVLGCVETPAELLHLLDLLAKHGFTHVTIDQGRRRRELFVGIDTLRASLARPEEGAEGDEDPAAGDS